MARLGLPAGPVRLPLAPATDEVVRRVGPIARPLTIVADAGNGVGGLYGPQMLRRIGPACRFQPVVIDAARESGAVEHHLVLAGRLHAVDQLSNRPSLHIIQAQ